MRYSFMKFMHILMAGSVLFFVFITNAEFVYAQDVDTDGDGLSDEQESVYYTDPNNPDTDGDDFLDSVEINTGHSPHARNKKMHENDYDSDGLNDLLEIEFGTDLGLADSDGDGHTDYQEVMKAYDPLDQSPLARLARRIEVDLSTQRLFYIVNETLVKNFPVSTGNPQTPTPPGEYKITRFVPVARYVGVDYDLDNVKWNMQFRKGGYFIHGAYWHNDFGKRTRSHGCVNMRTSDAEILYKNLEPGVPVIVKGKTPKRRTVGT